MTRSNGDGVGVVAIQFSPQRGDAERSRAGLDRLARDLGSELRYEPSDPTRACMLVRDVSVQVAERTWELALRVREQHLLDDRDVRIGVQVGTDSETNARSHAEALAEKARPGGIALSRSLLRQLVRVSWSDIEVDSRQDDILHFPALGGGISVARSERLDIRRYVAATQDGFTNREGFLDLPRHLPALSLIGDVLRAPRALILGTPWIGKTWIARQMQIQLERREPFVWRISFENPGGEPPIPLDSWERWRHSGRDGYVIVDAIDEGLDRKDEVRYALRLLRDNNPEHARLHVMAFSRPSHARQSAESLDWPERELSAISWHVQPLDVDEAARALATTATRVQRAGAHAVRLGDPMLVRDFHALRCLAEAPDEVDRMTLEERVLDRLCVSKHTRETGAGSGELREAAARLAAVLQFSGAETLKLRDEDVWSRRPDGSPVELFDAFPRPSDANLERAARSLASGPLFERVEGQGYRFRWRFAKERLAARALSNAPMPVVRALTAGPRGGVVQAQKEVVRQLVAAAGSTRQALRELEVEVARPLEVAEALPLLERILELSAGGARSWNLRHDDKFAALAQPAVAARVAKCIRDPGRTVASRQLALDIATANASAHGWRVAQQAALDTALDRTVPSEVRTEAAQFLCGLDGAQDLRRRLDVLLEAPEVESDEMRAIILTDRLARGAPVLEIASAAPERNSGSTDVRAMLFYALGRRLEDDDARSVVDQVLELRPIVLPKHALHELRAFAFDRWLKLAWDALDVERIVRIYKRPGEWDPSLESAIWKRVHADTELRRQLLLELSTSSVSSWMIELQSSDASWLADEIEQRTALSEQVLVKAYWLARRPPEADLACSRIMNGLRVHHADLVAMLESNVLERDSEVLRREQHAATTADSHSIWDVIEEILGADLDDSEKIQNLGWVLFDDRFRPEHVYGGFDDLGPERRSRVFEFLVRAFNRTTPTAVPTNVVQSYPAAISFEAAAFSGAVLHSDDRSWITGAVVASWLRPVLFGSGEARSAVIANCFGLAPDETRVALLESLGREARGRDYSNEVQDFPTAALRGDLTLVADALDIAASPGVRPGAARGIVWCLAGRLGSAVATPLAARRAWSSELAVTLRTALAFLRDGSGLHLVLPDPTQQDHSWLEPLLDRFARAWSIDLNRWDSQALGALAEWLVQAFPPSQDGPRPSSMRMYPVTDRLRHQDLRDRVVQMLIGREDPIALESCARLKAAAVSIGDYVDRVQSAREIDRWLIGVDTEAQHLTPRKIAEALDKSFSSQLRGADDLFFAVMELLGQIAADSGETTQLVWPDPVAQSKKRDQPEWRLAELVRIRLKDRLSGRFGETVQLLREVIEAHRDRPDLLGVVATTPRGEKYATVVIEFKWSDDRRLLPDLHKLANKYVLEKNRAHGIYVVGFSGRGSWRNQADLVAELSTRARELEVQHASVRLGVVVLPFLRDPTPKAKMSTAKTRSKTSRRKTKTNAKRKKRSSA